MTKIACPDCGADNSSNARFCNQCGHALVGVSAPDQKHEANSRLHYTPKHLVERVLKHRSAMQGERKQVTVFFADMANSTRLAEQVDPEIWHQILDEFFSILSEEVHRFEGTVNQYTGDGIMALFGAPLALEDHAQRAAFAALALRDRLREFADRLRLREGINLATRMGMNSGEVIVGSIGDDLRMDYTAKGLTVNLAARMEQIAEPGCVYLTRNTASLIEDYFVLRGLGPMPVKGSSEDIEVYELRDRSDISLRLDAARQRGLSGFCGRELELAALKRAQQRSHEGSSAIALVIGDAGLGKSRLCFEAVQLWKNQGLEVLSASGVPHGQAIPLAPVRQLLMQRFGVKTTETSLEARQKIAGALLMLDQSLSDELALLFEFLGVADQADAAPLPADAREHRMRSLFQRICALEPEQQRIVQIDDLHWLDAGSLDFLRIMLECKGAGTFVLLNMRPGTVPEWLAALEPDQLMLQPLNGDDMLKIAADLLGHGQGMDKLGLRLADRAAGNPFFIEEAVRALASAGDLVGQPGAYELLREPEQLSIAPTVQATIAGRVDRLDSDAKNLLQVAAVLGQSFEHRLLAAVAGFSEQRLDELRAELSQGHYLERDKQSDTRWNFTHPLLQEVVYGSLLNQQREALHRQVAELLQAYVGQSPCTESRLLLAQHWAAVGETLRAAEVAFQAAQELQHENAGESVRVMLQVVDWLTPVPDSDVARKMAFDACALVVRTATFFVIDAGRVDLCYEQARAQAESMGDQAMLAELMISNGARMLNQADADLSVANTGQAMALAQQVAERTGDNSLEQRFRIPILFSYFGAGRLPEGMQVLDQRDGGAWHDGIMDEDNMMSRGFRALMLAAMGQLQLAESELQQAITCSERLGRKVSWLYSNLVDVQIQRGTYEVSSDLATRAVSEAREFGSPLFEEIAARALAQNLIARGEAEEAVVLLKRASVMVQPGGVAAQFRTAHCMTLAQALRAAGDHAAAVQAADEGIDSGRESHQRLWLLRCLIERAQLQLESGETPEAMIAETQELIEFTQARLYLGDMLELQARWAAHCRNPTLQQQCIAAAVAHWKQCAAPARAAALLAHAA